MPGNFHQNSGLIRSVSSPCYRQLSIGDGGVKCLADFVWGNAKQQPRHENPCGDNRSNIVIGGGIVELVGSLNLGRLSTAIVPGCIEVV